LCNIIYHWRVKTDNNGGFWQYGDSFPAILIELSKPSLRLIVYMADHMRYDNKIMLDKYSKEIFFKTYDIGQKTISKALVELQMYNVVIRVSNGFYFINPSFIWRGDLVIKKQIITEYESAKNHKTQFQRNARKALL
jgi:hypothetical protein